MPGCHWNCVPQVGPLPSLFCPGGDRAAPSPQPRGRSLQAWCDPWLWPPRDLGAALQCSPKTPVLGRPQGEGRGCCWEALDAPPRQLAQTSLVQGGCQEWQEGSPPLPILVRESVGLLPACLSLHPWVPPSLPGSFRGHCEARPAPASSRGVGASLLVANSCGLCADVTSSGIFSKSGGVFFQALQMLPRPLGN